MLNKQQLLEVQKYFQCESDEIEHVEDDTYMVCHQEHIICADKKADELAADYIENSLWAFNPSFICDCIDGLSDSARTAIEDMLKHSQQTLCEDANDAILRLVSGNLQDLINAAIQANGRGHFLSSYDGEEIEIARGLYAYRQ